MDIPKGFVLMPARLIEDLVWIVNKLDRDYNNISMTESHDIVCSIEQVIKIARDQREDKG